MTTMPPRPLYRVPFASLLLAVAVYGVGCEPSPEEEHGETSTDSDADELPEPVCGNGEREADEECDDANDDEFDACLSSCMSPVRAAWSQQLESAAGPDALLFDPQGDLFALDFAGYGGFYRIQVTQFSRSGEVLWDWVDVGGEVGNPIGMARRPDGDLVILSKTSAATGLVALSPGTDDDPVWIDEIDSGIGGWPVTLAVDGDGNTMVVLPNAELRKYDPAGNLSWTVAREEPEQSNYGRDVLPGPDGEIYFVGMTRVDGSSSRDGWITRYDSRGSEQATLLVTDRELESAAIDSEGNLVVVGTAGDALWVGRYAPDLTELDETLIEAEDEYTATGHTLAVGPSSDVYLGGSLVPDSGSNFQASIERREPSLERYRWRQVLSSHRGNWDSVGVRTAAIAISPDESQVAVLINDQDSIGSSNAKLQVYDNRDVLAP